MKRLAWTVAGLTMLAASAPAQAAQAAYTCKDGTKLDAVFEGGMSSPGSATLTFGDGGVMKLPQAMSADGGRYVGGGTEFWIKGRGATLTRGGSSTTCTSK